MQDSVTKAVIEDLNRYYGKDFITFDKKGMTLHYRGSLKEFFQQEHPTDITKKQLIENEIDFEMRFGDFRDDVLGVSGSMEYCGDNDKLYPNHFGLTNAPLFSFGGFLYEQDELPIKYVFMYLDQYQLKDWVVELRKEGKVTFETFIDNSKIHESRLKEYNQ